MRAQPRPVRLETCFLDSTPCWPGCAFGGAGWSVLKTRQASSPTIPRRRATRFGTSRRPPARRGDRERDGDRRGARRRHGSAICRLRDTLRDTRRSVRYGPYRPTVGRKMALRHGPAPHDGLTGNVEGLVRDNRVEVRVLFGASHESPANRGAFAVLGRFRHGGGQSPRDNASGNWRTARVLQCSPTLEGAMSTHYDRSRDRWIVRWRENGRQRARRFDTEREARDFEAVMCPDQPAPEVVEPNHNHDQAGGDHAGVYPYVTTAGTRWRFVYRQSDGRLTTRRGFTSRRAAATAPNAAVEEVRRGEVVVHRDTFQAFWEQLLADKRPYVTPARCRTTRLTAASGCFRGSANYGPQRSTRSGSATGSPTWPSSSPTASSSPRRSTTLAPACR
jgi:hypothetical protein